MVNQQVVSHTDPLDITSLEPRQAKDQAKRYDLRGLGVLMIGADVTPELALDTIKSVSFSGAIFAPDTVRRALESRIHSGIRFS